MTDFYPTKKSVLAFYSSEIHLELTTISMRCHSLSAFVVLCDHKSMIRPWIIKKKYIQSSIIIKAYWLKDEIEVIKCQGQYFPINVVLFVVDSEKRHVHCFTSIETTE